MPQFDVYAYGMTVLSTIHLLKGKYPPPDAYQEIQQTYLIPGGEAANAAIVLRNLGVSVQLDGCYFGELTAKPLTEYLTARGVDCSLMPYHGDFPGWRDLVLCDGESRTIFGWFGGYLFGDRKLWTDPSEEAIRNARCVALDPFFRGASTRAAELCQKYQKGYVTIDWKWDDPIARNARAIVISKEFLDRDYPGADYAELYRQYCRACQGLVIFTWGGKELWYTAPGGSPKTFSPFSVNVVDTLAAGDTFRAGIVYGILKGMPDDETIRFASATAAVACTRFPSVYEPPAMTEIQNLLSQ
jgi:sugar/nucleoside kinase (ribokinase family)